MRTLSYCLLLIFVGFSVYFSVLKSPFYLDDIKQVQNNENIKKLKNIPSFYVQSNPFRENGRSAIGHFYKPLFYTSYAVLYSTGNGKPFIFHFFQILLYSLNAVLAFLVFTKFFGGKLAFLLALIFLVHPANEEVAQYIADLQDVLFFFFGMIALLVATTKNAGKKTGIILSPIFILLSCLSKETGVLFLFVFLLYIFLFKKNFFKIYLLSTGVATSIYLILRAVSISHPTTLISKVSHPAVLDERLILVPKIIYYYIKTIILPSPFLPNITYLQNKNLSGIILPVAVIIFALMITILTGFFIRKFYKSQLSLFIFMSAWALLGFGFHSQILPLDVIVASRWIYFPLVGILGMAGIVVTILKPYLLKYKLLFLVLYFMYIAGYIAATVKLNIIRQNPKLYTFESTNN